MWFGVTRLRCLADVQGTGRVYSEEKINVELPGRRGGGEDISEGSWM